MNKKKHVTRGKEPSSSPRYKEHSSQTELLCNVFSNNSRSRTFPLFILPKPFPRFKHLPPLPLVFFATISIQLAPLCHLLRIHSFERQFQACSQGNETLGPEHLTSFFPAALLPPLSCPRTCGFTGPCEFSDLQTCISIPASRVPDTQ